MEFLSEEENTIFVRAYPPSLLRHWSTTKDQTDTEKGSIGIPVVFFPATLSHLLLRRRRKKVQESRAARPFGSGYCEN